MINRGIIKLVRVAIAIIVGAILGMFLLEGIILHSYLWGYSNWISDCTSSYRIT